VTTNHELLALVWPDAFVEESILAVHISNLRKALGDARAAPRYIETVARTGYRFVADVRPVQPPGEPARQPDPPASHDDEATALYSRGRYLWERRTPDNARNAIGHFEAALEKDAGFALAWSGLAACYCTLPLTTGAQPREAFSKARAAAVRALELNASLCEAHLSLAGVRFWFDWDWPGAEREFRCAIDLDPNEPSAHRFYGHFLSNMGRHAESVREVGRALDLEPLSIVTNARLGQFLYHAGEHDRALRQLRSTLELEPNSWMLHLILGRVLETIGSPREALVELRQAVALANASGAAKASLGHALARSGDADDARRIYAELSDSLACGRSEAYHLALVAAGLGDRQNLHQWLKRALADRDLGLTFMRVEPRWRAYDQDPVVQDVMAALCFPTV
jgi:tetratricopeptide (TPR) repeat protein